MVYDILGILRIVLSIFKGKIRYIYIQFSVLIHNQKSAVPNKSILPNLQKSPETVEKGID
jgi:hypothetical protein